MMAVGAGLHSGATRGWNHHRRLRLPASKAEEKSGNQMTVSLAESKWEAAGIRIKPAAREIFTERTWRSGRIMLNEGADCSYFADDRGHRPRSQGAPG
jgi:hypothetical protein